MRERMPKVTAWIDALRDAFGRAEVDGWIRDGMANGSFCAKENGHTVGCQSADVNNGGRG